MHRYSAATRPWIPFHCDSAAVTVNIALGEHTSVRPGRGDEEEEEEVKGKEEEGGRGGGGQLLVLCENAVRAVHPRLAGEATVHDSSLLHAVSRVRRSVRYSLIIFYDLAPE